MSPSSNDVSAPPTRARQHLLVYLGSLTFVLYLDRVCLGQALVPISRELGISNSGMGWIQGAFTLAYGLFEVPTGHWGDRYGSRRMMTRIVLCWSAFTILTGCVPAFSIPLWSGSPTPPWAPVLDSFLLLFAIRFLFGAGEAGALPNVARIVSRWYPTSERPLAQAVVLTSMQLGGATAPVLAGFIIERFGWRMAFVAFGAVGVAWAAAFARWFRDDPSDHPGVNAAERDLILRGREPGQAGHVGHVIPWALVLSSRNVWLLGAIISCCAACSYFYMGWYPSYLVKGRAVAEIESKWLAGLVMMGGAAGALGGSWLGGVVGRQPHSERRKRGLTGCGLLVGSAVCLWLSLWCDSALHASLWVTGAYALAQAQLATWWTVVFRISGRHLGALFGLMNSLGIPGAFFANVFTGQMVDHRLAQGYVGRVAWDGVIICFIWILVAGAVMWLLVDPDRSAVGDERPEFAHG